MKLNYQAYDQSGRLVNDAIEAADAGDAADQLRRQGLFVTRMSSDGQLAAAPSAAGKGKGRLSESKRLKYLSMFTRQLYVLSSTGTPLVESLGALQRQAADPVWAGIVGELRQTVEEGLSLSEAMKEHPGCFDPVYRSLVAAGESGGEFETMLDRLATMVGKQSQARRTIAGAMVYPILLLSVSLIVLVLMLLFVLPRFTGLFETLKVPLPPTTQALVFLSDGLRGYWWLASGLLIAGGFGLRYWLKTPGGRDAWDTGMIRLPILRNMTRGFATARLTRLLGTLLESHVPLLDSLTLTREAAGNQHYRRLIDKAEEAVTRGEPISTAFRDASLISPSVYEAIHSGEATGQVGALLLNIANFLDEENEIILRSLTSIVEPVIMIVLGSLVGFVAVSMFLPLFDLTAAAGGAH